MTLHKDQPSKRYLWGLIQLTPRDKVVRQVKWPWLTWIFIVGAAIILVGAITAGILSGVKFF